MIVKTGRRGEWGQVPGSRRVRRSRWPSTRQDRNWKGRGWKGNDYFGLEHAEFEVCVEPSCERLNT